MTPVARRSFRRSGVSVLPLGLGCMRLPLSPDDPSAVDEDRSVAMIRAAVDGGVDYLDTAWPYCGGRSEPVVGRALRGGYRERVRLATKLPTWLVEDVSDVDRFLNEQLDRLQTDVIDFYMVHALRLTLWRRMLDLGVMDALERAKSAGRIRHLGFSFHDAPAAFRPILEGWDWDFTQIQYNVMDEEFQAGTAGLRLAAGRGVDVIAMEPLRGGRMTSRIPAPIQALWDALPPGLTPAAALLRWVLDQPGVTLVLSGMSDEAQLTENLAITAAFSPGSRSELEQKVLLQVRDAYRARTLTGCTGCAYCTPCPAGVHIPRILSLYDDAVAYDAAAGSVFLYNNFVAPGERADRCTDCGACEEACPQGVSIRRHLAAAHRLLAKAPAP